MNWSVEPISAAVHLEVLHMGEVQLLNEVLYKVLRMEMQQVETCEGGGRHVLQCRELVCMWKPSMAMPVDSDQSSNKTADKPTCL